MKKLSLILILSFISLGIEFGYSQNNESDTNPFAQCGIKAKVATFSDFPEFHDKQRIVEIGSVKYDVHSKKIIGFADMRDTVNYLRTTPGSAL